MVSTSIFILSIGLVNFDSVFCGNRGSQHADNPANEDGNNRPIPQENRAQQNRPGNVLNALLTDYLLPIVAGVGTGAVLDVAIFYSDHHRSATGLKQVLELGTGVGLAYAFISALATEIRNNRGDDETLAQDIIRQLRERDFPLPGNARQVVVNFLSQIRQRLAEARGRTNNNNNINQGDIEMGHGRQ